MNLKIFKDVNCDYYLSWIVCDMDRIDKNLLRFYQKEKLDLNSDSICVRLYDTVATFVTKELAEEYIKFKQGGKNV